MGAELGRLKWIKLTDSVWEQGAEENIWTEEEWSGNEELDNLYSSPKCNYNYQVNLNEICREYNTNESEGERM
jgi:hypothetical protein